jgi:hypothetical protein
VDFDTWISVIHGLQREGVTEPNAVFDFCEARGFPVGRTDAVDSSWRHVVETDQAAAEWYRREMLRPKD